MPLRVGTYAIEDMDQMSAAERTHRIDVALARDYGTIKQDPRYLELLAKYDPSVRALRLRETCVVLALHCVCI